MRIILLFLMVTIFCSEEKIRKHRLNSGSLRRWVNPEFMQDDREVSFIIEQFIWLIRKSSVLCFIDGRPCEYQCSANRESFFPDLMRFFLEEVAAKTQKKDPIAIFEFDGGNGSRVWQILYAIRNSCPVWICTHNYEPISKNDLGQILTHYNKLMNPAISMTFLQGKLSWVSTNQVYHKKFDFFNAYNMMHLLNPHQYQPLLHIICNLLKEGGNAFVSGRTMPQYSNEDENPSFVSEETIESAIMDSNGMLRFLDSYLKKRKPVENQNDLCGFKMSPWVQAFLPDIVGQELLVYRRTVTQVINYVTKKTIREAVNLFNQGRKAEVLRITKMFYADENGLLIQDHIREKYRNPEFLCVTIEKQG